MMETAASEHPIVESPAWRAGRGPLKVLPAPLFEDRRAWLAILLGWVLALAGSVAIGFVITRLVPGGAGPDLGEAPPMVLWGMIALFSPITETLLMAGVLGILRRFLGPWQAVIASAILWGLLHSTLAPLWGAVIWWPFLIFSTLYTTWRPRGFWVAVGVPMMVHILQNAAPATMIVLGR
ncbi:CPBP family intramembrane glutamic endopeptidase [Sphingomonas beigongshangi]|jgi:membrane protease YdiL (CAAX protease family)|uniref:CPBP family intramembrane glutamic endopeptidase n=1 Tax=Sphingomonas beigongshangi TaxID=2782540 RepID=UPI001FF03193|nr:CPBP family intramembrane glutamic endopeptidase [Sphingomonas beigongshangi]